MSSRTKDPPQGLQALAGDEEMAHQHEEKVEAQPSQLHLLLQQRKQLPSKSAAYDEEEDAEDASQYLIPVMYQDSARPSALSPPLHHYKTDDDESNYFMSEPSLSEDGDSTSRVRARHQADLLGTGILSDDIHRTGTFQSVSSEDDIPEERHQQSDNLRGGRAFETPSGSSGNEVQQQNNMRTPEQGRRRERHQNLTPQLSPGNTSLSSWDSPAITHQQFFFQVEFPESKYEKQARRQQQEQQQQQQQQQHHHHHHQQQQQHASDSRHSINRSFSNGSSRRADGSGRHSRHRTSGGQNRLSRGDCSGTGSFYDRLNSKSEQNSLKRESQQNGGGTSQIDSADAFLQNLRIQSQGAFEERQQSDLLTPMSGFGTEQTKVEAVMRRGQNGGSSKRDGSVIRSDECDSVRGDTISLPSTIAHGNARQTNNDDSMVMTLSDSDNGDGADDSNRGSTPGEYEGQNSADDEKTVERPPRIRSRPTPGHRRTRSGDEAAAEIATGGKDWKGMEQDRIPLPVQEGDEDDDHPLVSGDMGGRRLQQYNWFSGQPENESSSGTQGSASASAGSSGQLQSKNAGLPPIPGRDQQMLYWSPMGPNRKDVGGDSRQAWMSQMSQIQSSGSLNSHGSLHSLEETPEEYSDDESSTGTGEDAPMSVAQNRVSLQASIADPAQLEHMFQEGVRTSGSGQAHLRQASSPFANIGKKSANKAHRATFLPTSYHVDDPGYPTYVCPRCDTRQREFFTVENASGKFGGPGGYLALYFFLYVVCSLFIFGLEEGWMPLDCIYFAVITLTTAGLGDFVPTSDANKMICSMFIYFGVACIGLLLGSYIAGMMDERALRERKENQIDACPNCARIRSLQETAERNGRMSVFSPDVGEPEKPKLMKFASERFDTGASPAGHAAVYSPIHHNHYQNDTSSRSNDSQKTPKNHGYSEGRPRPPPPPPPPPPPAAFIPTYDDENFAVASQGVNTSYMLETSPEFSAPSGPPHLGSPVTRSILGRQSHTRHASLDIRNDMNLLGGALPKTYGTADVRVRTYSDDYQGPSAISVDQLGGSRNPRKLKRIQSGTSLADEFSDYSSDNEDNDDASYDESESSSYSSDSESSAEELWDTTKSKIQVAKYIFLTLRLALFNSMVIIAVGCVGFWLIEGFTWIDGWYFTTVLLTTVGYGDIVPITKGGKLFATIYVLVAGTILLNNMSTISMIPLELRRRRIERAILTQFGDHLDDAALRELATGPVIQRLNLSANRADGLDECTREMFSLAMLVRLGKVTEHDIRETFAAFRHLDVNDEGVLNSKSIIAGLIAKQRRANNAPPQQTTAPPSPPPPPPYQQRGFTS